MKCSCEFPLSGSIPDAGGKILGMEFVYACVCVCVCVCIYVCAFVFVYMCVFVCYVGACVYVCLCVYVCYLEKDHIKLETKRTLFIARLHCGMEMAGWKWRDVSRGDFREPCVTQEAS